MRPLLLATLAVLLAGCSTTESPRATELREVSVSEGAAAPLCGEDGCAWEWWNLTVEGGDWFQVRAPVPVVAPYGPVPSSHDAIAWAAHLAATPPGNAILGGEGDRTKVLLMGEGETAARAWTLRTDAPEQFLRARWGPRANETRPDAVELHVMGTVERIEFTYEAHSALCERHARYAWEADGTVTMDGALWLAGSDQAVCR